MNQLKNLVNLYVFCIVYSPLYCNENVFSTALENTTVTINETFPTSRKMKDNDRHAISSYSVPEMQLRMVTVCNTPNEDMGYCMPIRNCSLLMNQLENVKANKFLRESRCGPKNENSANPYVCCGKYDNYKNLVNENPFPKTCGKSVKMKSRIIGGKEAALGEFPWMARLIHRNRQNIKTFGCSGFLITPKFVLTAAHCLKSENVKILGPIFEVQFGEHNTETKIDCNSRNTLCADKPQVIRVKKCIVHPNYDMSSVHHHHDIGLIHLRRAAQTTNYVSPICLLENDEHKPFEYWISGWGSTRTRKTSPIKMKVSLPPYPHSNCTEQYKMVNVHVTEKQICAGGRKNKDSCTGDSGGPLMMANKSEWFAAGIVSFGLGCGREGWPGIYTNVTSYMPWIRKTIMKKVKPKS